MSQQVLLRAKGLYSYPNLLSEIPQGALTQADNVVVYKEGIIESRRGFKLYGNAFGSSTDRTKQLLIYKDRILRHYSSVLQYDNGTGTFASFSGSFSEVNTGLRIKGTESNGNFYFTTSSGIKKISVNSASQLATTTITNAGMPRGLDLQVTGTADASGFLPTNNVVAYRVLWGIKDANQNLILGAPSNRVIYRNSSGSTQKTTLTFPIPDSITVDHFYQIYRTVNVTPSTSDPGDEMQLVYEDNPTSAQITAKLITVDDITPEDFLGVFLYTNPNSGEGINNANEMPPLSSDVALYKNTLFFSDTETKYRKFITLLGVSNLTAGVSTFVITDGVTTETYTFDVAEDVATKKIQLFTGGTAAQNVDDTTRSLVKIINRQTSGLVYASYLSGNTDSELPGKFLLESRTLGSLQFQIEVNDDATTGIAFSPNLPDSASGFDELSDNEISPNRIYYSKVQQPEAVPLLNYFDVGPRDKAILRILALRDSLFILKEEGIYRLSGESGAFVVQLFDNSTIIKGADTAAVLNNQIYMLSNQGVATVSENGVQIISRAIEDNLVKLLIPSYTSFSTASFGVSYETDRAYFLWTVTETSDTKATQAFIYNTFTQAWSRHPISKTCGIVNPSDNKMYLGAADTNFNEQERKTLDRTDFADREYSFTLANGSVNGSRITVSNTSNIIERDVLLQTQYLTINQLNRLLRKLDDDTGVADTDYLSLLEASAGESLRDILTSLATKLDADAGVTDINYVGTIVAYTSSFIDTQSAYNAIINKLNLDTGVGFINYPLSSGTVDFEIIITEIINTNQIEVEFSYPLIAGPITIFSHIDSQVTWAPQFFGDPSMSKQIRESTLILQQNNISQCKLAFSSDIDPGFDEIVFDGNGNGIFGSGYLGENPFGGSGTSAPFRTLVPREKQRCRYINLRFSHNTAREMYGVYGISLTGEITSPRAFK